MIDQEDEEKFPIEDWRYDVANRDTIIGYVEWVEHRKESERFDTEIKESQPPASISWSVVKVSAQVLSYLGVTHMLWVRLFDGERIYTCLPAAQTPGPDDGGYRAIETALTIKGLMSSWQWANGGFKCKS